MVPWRKFEARIPQMAAVGFKKMNRRITYLATLKKDGAPNLHPVTPFIGGGMLFMFTEPSSPKITDLRRDSRYALHSSVARGEGEPLVEFLLTGGARIIEDPSVRAEAMKIAASPVVIEAYVLFEFLVERALLIEYDQDGKRNIQRWQVHPPKQHGGILIKPVPAEEG
jgi:hypothetical protein